MAKIMECPECREQVAADTPEAGHLCTKVHRFVNFNIIEISDAGVSLSSSHPG